MDKKELLKEWTIQTARHRDLFYKTIKKIDEQNGKVIIDHKTKQETYLIIPLLDKALAALKLEDKTAQLIIVTLNTKKNVSQLHTIWKDIIEYSNLKIIFVNPFIEPASNWSIQPHVHNKICDQSSLKKGLLSIFEGTEEVTKKDLT